MKSGNPALKENTFTKFQNVTNSGVTEFMTLNGTINKSYILLGLLVLGAFLSWYYSSIVLPFMIPIIIVNFILCFIIILKKELSPYLVPVYAIIEGGFIGVVSLYYSLSYSGIVIQAVLLTFGVFLMMLLLYQRKIIKATENFKKGVFAATGAIAIVYLVSIFGQITNLYNIGYIHSVGGIMGICISLFIVTIASLNLILDFDFIENSVKANAPKYMEWYASFGLLVTLVWLYIEILRLLAKSRD